MWQKGIEIVKAVYTITDMLQDKEKYSLTSKKTRTAISIPSNIAEESSKKSEKEYFRFLEIALGSSFEVEPQTVIIEELNYIRKDKLKDLLEMLE